MTIPASWWITEREQDGTETVAYWKGFPSASACRRAIARLEWPVWQDLTKMHPRLWTGGGWGEPASQVGMEPSKTAE